MSKQEMRNQERENEAKRAVKYIRERFSFADTPMHWAVGLVLGTGWGDVLDMKVVAEIPFRAIPGFEALGHLRGHARRLVMGRFGRKPVYVLRGRVHMNESPNDPNFAKMVRLQTEMLFQFGVRKLIVTSAVGSLRGALEVGQIAVIDGFVTVYAPEMPLWAGEFCSPEDTLSPRLRKIAREQRGELVTREVGHAMVRGPFFEGRKYDKALLAQSGAGVVGMSMLPEACVAALYDAEVLGLGFVTNDDVAEHSHEANQACAARSAVHLGEFLARIVSRV